MNRLSLLLIPFAALALPLSQAKADNWNETTEGLLSNDGNFPTFINLTAGDNLIEGTMGLGTADVWTFTIAAGYYLSGINLLSYSDNGAGQPLGSISSFMAIDDATTIDMATFSSQLSNGLWNEQSPDGGTTTFTDLLAILQSGPAFGGGPGFSGQLGAGNYTFGVSDDNYTISYCIDFVVTPVPEPGTVSLMALAGLLMLRRRRLLR